MRMTIRFVIELKEKHHIQLCPSFCVTIEIELVIGLRYVLADNKQ